MHHALDAADSHSLDYLASVYTYQPYWKDEAKDAEEVVKYAKDLDALWVYNGLDCCLTYEIWQRLYEELVREGMVEFYLKHYAGLLGPLLRMMWHGVRVDKKRQKDWGEKLKKDMVKIREELEAEAGENLFATEKVSILREPSNEEWDMLLTKKDLTMEDYGKEGAPKAKFIDKEAREELRGRGCTYFVGGQKAGKIKEFREKDKKGFSPSKLKRFFYGTLGLPEQKKYRKGTGKSSVSLDEGAIRKLTARFPNRIKNYGNLLIAYREKEREGNYLKGAWDKDGRIRCSYKMTTEAGRLASSKNPKGTGFNMQNIKR